MESVGWGLGEGRVLEARGQAGIRAAEGPVSTVTVNPVRTGYSRPSSFDEAAMLRIALIVAVVALSVLLVSALPSIRRYLRMRSM